MERTKSIDDFDASVWYNRLIATASNSNSLERYNQLVQLHKETLAFYIPALRSLTNEQASATSSDGRPIAIVVAHIMGWEEWQVQIFTDANRNARLNEQMQLQGYFDTDTNEKVSFSGVDDFNAYQAKKYMNTPWQEIKDKAIQTASDLQSVFPENPSDEWIDFLDHTPLHTWHLTPEHTLEIPAGWYLWMVSLKHEAVEHRKDLLHV